MIETVVALMPATTEPMKELILVWCCLKLALQPFPIVSMMQTLHWPLPESMLLLHAPEIDQQICSKPACALLACNVKQMNHAVSHGMVAHLPFYLRT